MHIEVKFTFDSLEEMNNTLTASLAGAASQQTSEGIISNPISSTVDMTDKSIVNSEKVEEITLGSSVVANVPAAPEAGEEISSTSTSENQQELGLAEEVGELDSRGFPWDERIHSSNQSKVASGAWKYRRGIDTKYKQMVEDEIKHEQQSQPAPETTVTTASPGIPAETNSAAGTVPPARTAEVTVPPAPGGEDQSAATTGAVPADGEELTWPKVMARLMAAGKHSDMEALKSAAEAVGVAEFALLAKRPDLYEMFLVTMGV